MKPKIQVPDKLLPLYEDKWRYLFLEGGRGGAKSHGVATSQLIRGRKRPMLFLDAREIQKSIADSVHSLLQKKIKELGLGDFYRVTNTEINGLNGTKFIFAGLKHNIDNIKSIEDVDECWIEEGQLVSKNTWTKLIPTIRKELSPCCYAKLEIKTDDGFPCSKCGNMIQKQDIIPSRIITTYNPELDEDPTYVLGHSLGENGKLIQMNYWDNPWFPNVLEEERLKCKRDNPADYEHIWEGKCLRAVAGAIFADVIEKASEITESYPDSRITKVPYDKTKPVDIFYDLGRGDKTAMWFVQQIGYEIRHLHYYENNGEHFSHYIKYAKSLPYVYGKQYLPHDAENENIAAERTIKQQAYDAFGGGIVIIPRIPRKALAIDAARGIADRCVWDKDGCADGLTCLKKYAYKVDVETGRTSREPEHDTPWSHGADAWMAIGQSFIPHKKKQEKQRGSIYSGMPR